MVLSKNVDLTRTYYVLGGAAVRIVKVQKGGVKADVIYLEDACRRTRRYKGSTHTVYLRSLWLHKKCPRCGRGFCDCLEAVNRD